jgi:hypothetical protein
MRLLVINEIDFLNAFLQIFHKITTFALYDKLSLICSFDVTFGSDTIVIESFNLKKVDI